jgi:hypothetical protein
VALYNGNGGYSKDLKEAFKYFNAAAEKGHPRAANYVGFMHKNGEGTSVNFPAAIQWYQKSAELGYAAAMNNLGTMFREGSGVSVDYQEAMKWFTKGAEGGNAQAMTSVGFLLERGMGVTKDAKLAVTWYEKANATGEYLHHAKFLLGMTFARGIGSPLNMSKAEELFQQSTYDTPKYRNFVVWLEKLAQDSKFDANSLLGVIYEKGLLGVTKDKEKAVEFFSMASMGGDQFSLQQLQRLDPKPLELSTPPAISNQSPSTATAATVSGTKTTIVDTNLKAREGH